MALTFSEYQQRTADTAKYPDVGRNPVYPTLGLAGEAGEVCEKVKKVLRDQDGQFDPDAVAAIKKELGDVLWYVARLAAELDLPLDEIAADNLAKLASRQARGKLHGSGDER
ncbi:MAG: nucleoside triphosphate pyrophosphohydrolase family protein [Chloroflexi bacterium]|nr:nucleoside triphosphate pyrophosphohydrolase family protein [Chloroflexota bacterium]